MIAHHWTLPERLAAGITHHHAPAAGHDVVCDGVYLANLAAKRIGEGVVFDEAELVPDPAALERLGITPAVWESIVRGAAGGVPIDALAVRLGLIVRDVRLRTIFRLTRRDATETGA